MARSAAGRAPLTKQAFGRRLRRLRPELEETQRTMEGVRRWVYQGINMKGGDSGRSLQREADAAGRFRTLPAAEGG